MSNSEDIVTLSEEPIFIVGTSGRLPLRTIGVLELTSAEIPASLRKYQALLGDRLHVPTTSRSAHPSRLVKGEYAVRMAVATSTAARALGRLYARQLTDALAEFPRPPIVAHMTKRHAQKAEWAILDRLCTALDGRPSGLALMHTSRGITWYRLTPRGPGLDRLTRNSPALGVLPCPATEVELLLTVAKLATYAAYQHRCYPDPSCRPTWLPPKLRWADPDQYDEILTFHS
ncbi:hypothetical protein ACIQRE_12895 [Streptomyces griseoluteus]|uniref:hypothetical protein n=1 Tax=Streptomyces griseoluteus TaxID=29306 RepID=UPI00381D4722